jgi:hypothetical protein
MSKVFSIASLLSLLLFVTSVVAWRGRWGFDRLLVDSSGSRIYMFSLGRYGLNVAFDRRDLSPDFRNFSNITKSDPVNFAYLFLEIVREADVPTTPIVRWKALVPPWFLIGPTAVLPAVWTFWKIRRHRYRAGSNHERSQGFEIAPGEKDCTQPL